MSAVKDEHLAEGNDAPPRRLSNVLEGLASTLAIAAGAWYALLTLSYDQFYRRLAVSLGDVGLSYTAILANSVGTAFGIVVFIVLISLPIIAMRKVRRRETWRQESFKGFVRRVMTFSLVGCFVLAVIALPMLSSANFKRVVEGKAVLPPRLPVANFAILPIHADPVAIEPKNGNTLRGISTHMAKYDSESGARLLYLGQANSQLVIYDSVEDHVVYVPSSDAIVRITNCHVREPPKPICANARSVIWPFSIWQRP
jgi:hypothetical protein